MQCVLADLDIGRQNTRSVREILVAALLAIWGRHPSGSGSVPPQANAS
jgi:hypothetical protein